MRSRSTDIAALISSGWGFPQCLKISFRCIVSLLLGVKCIVINFLHQLSLSIRAERSVGLRTRATFEIMCKTELFPEAGELAPECICLLHDDKPLTMKELNMAKVYDFDFKYGQKSAWDFSDDLAAIDLSMRQSPKVNLHRGRKRRKYPKFRFVPCLEDIKENELFEAQLEHLNKLKKDLASIHEERALNCGMPVLKDEGRRHRRKRHGRA